MKIKLRFWNCSNAASDGSRIPLEVFDEYFRSSQYQEAIESKSMLCSLTHRSRNLKSAPPEYQSLKATVGNDDLMLCVDHNTPSPIMYLDRMYYDAEIGWVCADATVLDESTADEDMAKQIKRFKSLLREGVKLGCSAVVVAYWDNAGTGGDICRKINSIKGVDITLNPSQKGARVTDIYEDENEAKEFSYLGQRKFSEVDIRVMNSGTPVTKLFSATEIAPDLPKTSKVGLKFTSLKVKEFSSISDADIFEEEQKEFSVGSLKERLRVSKLSPRQNFRRLVLDYKQLCKAQGGASKMDPEDLKVLKSLFTSDILMILRQIHPEILQGKQISTLLGASSLGKATRVAAQKLQIPYKLASKEVEKSGMLSKPRFAKLQEAYFDFINSMIDEVFNDHGVAEKIEENIEEED